MYQWCINNNKAELIVVTWDMTEFVMFIYFLLSLAHMLNPLRWWQTEMDGGLIESASNQ